MSRILTQRDVAAAILHEKGALDGKPFARTANGSISIDRDYIDVLEYFLHKDGFNSEYKKDEAFIAAKNLVTRYGLENAAMRAREKLVVNIAVNTNARTRLFAPIPPVAVPSAVSNDARAMRIAAIKGLGTATSGVSTTMGGRRRTKRSKKAKHTRRHKKGSKYSRRR
jgi:hypothetical protein